HAVLYMADARNSRHAVHGDGAGDRVLHHAAVVMVLPRREARSGSQSGGLPAAVAVVGHFCAECGSVCVGEEEDTGDEDGV
ncbi:hypothetical protein LTR60_000996, partial [Cryomyces antarcticus]